MKIKCCKPFAHENVQHLQFWYAEFCSLNIIFGFWKAHCILWARGVRKFDSKQLTGGPGVEQAMKNWGGEKFLSALFSCPTIPVCPAHLLGAHALFAPPPVEVMHAVIIMSLKTIGLQEGFVLTSRQIR